MSAILVTKRRRKKKMRGKKKENTSIKVADTCIEEGHIEIETLTKGKVINRDKLIQHGPKAKS